ncbi:MAG: hypothetical protein MJ113_06715 [Lachnospiraceae bacterium]|nr:hypothetical protein [Lachnospiraceae bacterium]
MKNVVNTVNNDKSNKNKPDASKLKITALVSSLVVVLVVLLIVIEALGNGKMVVKNDTDLKLEDIDIYFMSDYMDNEEIFDIASDLSLESGKKEKINYKSVDMTTASDFAALTVVFKFEGEKELQVSSGEFHGKYDGKINIAFEKKGENYFLTLKTGAGLFYGTSGRSDCDDKYLLSIKEGFVY